MTITNEEIARLRALEAAATGAFSGAYGDPGYRSRLLVSRKKEEWELIGCDHNNDGATVTFASFTRRADAYYFAAAAWMLPALLDEIERLRERCDQMHQAQLVPAVDQALLAGAVTEVDNLRAEIARLRASQNERAIEALYEVRRKAIDYEGDWLSTEIDAHIAALEADEIQPGPEATAPQSDEDGA